MSTAKEVYNELNSNINTSDNSMDIWGATTDPSLTTLKPVLTLFGITGAYILKSVNLKLNEDKTVNLMGSSIFSQPGAIDENNKFKVSVTVIFKQSDQTFNITFYIQTPTFLLSDFFLILPPTLRSGVIDNQEDNGIRWYSSCLGSFTLEKVIFYADTNSELLNMSGTLQKPMDNDLVKRLFLLGNWPIKFSGTVIMPLDAFSPPIINLKAVGKNLTINAGKEGGTKGPGAFPIKSIGLMIISEKLGTPQFDHTHFSTLRICGDIELGGITGTISTLILSTGKTWSFQVTFSKNATIVQGLSQLSELFGVDLPIPMNFPVLSEFYVAEIDLDLNNDNPHGKLPRLTLGGFAITIKSDETWVPPVPFVTISNVGTRWVWAWTMVNSEKDPGKIVKSYLLTGTVFGTLNIGDDNSRLIDIPPDSGINPEVLGGNSVALDVKLTIPDFFIYGNMRVGDYIPIGSALQYYFGSPGPETKSGMNVTQLSFSADPYGQNYSGSGTITFGNPETPDPNQGWDIDLIITTISLQELELFIEANGGKITGGIKANFLLDDGSGDLELLDYQKPRLMVSAQYPTQNPDNAVGWIFSGKLYDGTSINLTSLVQKFITGNSSYPPWIPELKVDRLYGEISTGTKDYRFGGTISGVWSPEIFGTQLKIAAAASVDMIKQTSLDKKANGKISGFFSVNKIALSAGMNFGDPEPTYQFKIQFDQLWLEAVTSWRGTDKERHQVISIQLGGITLGDMVEYLVNLAAPTLGFTLDSPWDALKRIDLSSFVLTVDPKENIVEFIFNANVDLVIMQIDSVGIRYAKNSGKSKVEMILTGDFIGKKYTDQEPLSWDVINEPPPTVPGAGKSLVKLNYVGIGQRVTFNKPDSELPETVAGNIKLLRESMKPEPKDSNKNPLTDLTGMTYSSDSQWLIGLDIELMETVALGIIFNDPRLYGLSIALSGNKAGSLAGLRFELLYKKITNDIGMFRVELRVPDQFRTFQLGAASFTLGIIVVEVYTNGNFKVDLGFPYNRNFDRAFSLSAGLLIGRGGIYFGLLNGETSSQVPKITNGYFSPVLELGIGMAAGVGKELNAGIFSGGIYVELEVVFQGVLAWFHPVNNGTSPAKYYSCKGIVAIHGKVYGSVDFVLIKASVTVDAYAQALVVYECYKLTIFRLSAEVSAEAKIKVLFVTIHYSFKFHLETSFTIGSTSTTPWIIGSDINNNSRLIFTKRINPLLRKALLRKSHISNMIKNTNIGNSLVWKPSNNVFGLKSPKIAHLTMLPLFTLANVPVSWSSIAPKNNDLNYRVAFILTAETGIIPSANKVEECFLRSGALSPMSLLPENTEDLASDILVKGLFLYAINSVQRMAEEKNIITSGQLEHLEEELNNRDTLDNGFSLDKLNTFFYYNINIILTGDLDVKPEDKGAMVFPMPPWINFDIATISDKSKIDFTEKNKIGSIYEWGISQFLGKFSPVGSESTSKPTDDDPSKYESFASYMFRDFCLMIVKNSVKEAITCMEKYTLAVTVNEYNTTPSLSDIAKSLPTAKVVYTVSAGNTIDSVASDLGTTVEELLLLNSDIETKIESEKPGTSLFVNIGVAPETLAEENADIDLNKAPLNLGTIYYQVKILETFDSVGKLFNTNIPDILGFSNPKRIDISLDPNLLLPASTFNMPQRSITTKTVIDQKRVAATFYTRYVRHVVKKATDGTDIIGWYAEAISKISSNIPIISTLIQKSGELEPGHLILVPNNYNSNYSDSKSCNSYITIAGDTLLRIGATLALEQDLSINPNKLNEWNIFLSKVSSTTDHTWNIPEISNVVIEEGENIESLTRRLIIDAEYNNEIWIYNWLGVSTWIKTAQIIAPMAIIPVPEAKTDNIPLTFNKISSIYGIAVADAVEILKTESNLFKEKTVLTVNHLPAQDISILVESILKENSFTSIVNQSSRMLMAGLNLPKLKSDQGHTIADTTHLAPLYDLTGQQMDILTKDANDSDNVLVVSSSSKVKWIKEMNSITVTTGTTEEQILELEKQYPDLKINNPCIQSFTYPLQSSIVLLTETTPILSYKYTLDQIKSSLPKDGLAIKPALNVLNMDSWAMPLYGETVQTYNFDNRIDLQVYKPLEIQAIVEDNNKSGLATLWPFPESLINCAISGAKSSYEILTSSLSGLAARHANTLESTTYGVLVPFRISRLDNGTNNFNLLGVDTDKRQLLLDLKKHLKSEEKGTICYLLVSPAPNSSNAEGTTLLSSDPEKIYLIKSNLSTESEPQPILAATNSLLPEEIYSSTLNSLEDFLLLLWQGSVVGGTGYYFGIADKLPGSLFDSNGVATLQLLIITKSQQSKSIKGRKLLPFNNTLLVGPSLSNRVYSLYAESYEDTDMVKKAILPPGNVGFRIATNIPLDEEIDNKVNIRKLYSLMSYHIEDINNKHLTKKTKLPILAPYVAPVSGMPSLPRPWDGVIQTLPQVERLKRRNKNSLNRKSEPYWLYEQVLPIYKFIKPEIKIAAPDVPGLPNKQNDPYAGLGLQESIPETNFKFDFVDILGNFSKPLEGDEGCAAIPLGYTDNLIGVGEWPSISYFYSINSDTQLTVSISPKPSELIPTSSQSGDYCVQKAVKQAEKYAQSYYQLIQGNIKGYIETTLNNLPNGIKLDNIKPLINFVTSSYIHAKCAASISATIPNKPTTIESLLKNYNIRNIELAEANADRFVNEIFTKPGLIVIPSYFSYIEYDSTTDLCLLHKNSWPSINAITLLNVPQNLTIPLKKGTALKTPIKNIQIGGGAEAQTLKDIASRNNTSVDLLSVENSNQHIFSSNFEFAVDSGSGQEVIIKTIANILDTPQQIVDKLSSEYGVNISVVNLVGPYANDQDLLDPNKVLESSSYIVQEKDTLSKNRSGFLQAELITNNIETVDIFEPGTLLYFGNYENTLVATDDPQILRQFADNYGCPLELLLAQNQKTEITSMQIPGIFSWPTDSDKLKVPYTIIANDTLTRIASNFNTKKVDGFDIVSENLNMKGILTTKVINVKVNSNNKVYTITPPVDATFNSVLAQLKELDPAGTLQDIVSSITNQKGVLQESGLLINPLVKINKLSTPQDINTNYGITIDAFSLCNTATPNLIEPNIKLESNDKSVSITSKTGDTFNSLIVRFFEKDINVNAAEISNNNIDVEFLSMGSLAFLPPSTAKISTEIGSIGPYPGPVFPLKVYLNIERPETLISDGFDKRGPVGRCQTIIPAPAHSNENEEKSLTFNNFVKDMEAALPDLRLGTAKVNKESSDLWCVDFTKTGISEVTITGGTKIKIDEKEVEQPRYFALKPLCDSLVYRTGIYIKSLTNGELGNEKSSNFQGIDIEIWAERFLSDFDRILSGSYATALYENTSLNSYLNEIIENKKRIVPSISSRLDYLLTLSETSEIDKLNSARESLEQQLGVSLIRTFDTSIIIQYDTTVKSVWETTPTLLSAKLYGLGSVDSKSTESLVIKEAKIELDKASSFINFLTTVQNPSKHKEISGLLNYDISHLEFDIKSVATNSDYVSSNWLSFLPLLLGNEKPSALIKTDPIPVVHAPVPLKIFPELPTILGQKSIGKPKPIEIFDYSIWDYIFIYSHTHAEQDLVKINAEFNLRESNNLYANTLEDDLFTSLAQYEAVADELWNNLNCLVNPNAIVSPVVIENSVKTVTALITDITNCWINPITPSQQITNNNDQYIPDISYKFDARVDYKNNTYSLTVLEFKNLPRKTIIWPTVIYIDEKGDENILQSSKEKDSTVIYSFPSKDKSFYSSNKKLTFKLSFDSLIISEIKNASASIFVERNQKLISNSTVKTNSQFLFKTSEVKTSGISIPLLISSNRIEMTGNNLESAINNTFLQLFPLDNRLEDLKLTIGIYYAFELNEDKHEPLFNIITKIPVSLYPDRDITLTLGDEISKITKNWTTENNPNTDGGEWNFSIVLYSTNAPMSQPLLSLDQLYYKIK